MAGSVALLAGALQRAQMAIAHGASGTATRGRSTSTDRKRGWRPWQNPLTEVMKGALYRIFGELDLPARYRYTTPCRYLSLSRLNVKCRQNLGIRYYGANVVTSCFLECQKPGELKSR